MNQDSLASPGVSWTGQVALFGIIHHLVIHFEFPVLKPHRTLGNNGKALFDSKTRRSDFEMEIMDHAADENNPHQCTRSCSKNSLYCSWAAL